MSETQAFCPAGTEIAFASILAPAVFTTIGEVTSIVKAGQKRETDDATSLDSTSGYRETIPTIKAPGEYTVSYNFVPGDAGQALVSDLFESGDRVNWKITLPGTKGHFTFKAFISEYGNFNFPVDKKATSSLKVMVTGPVVENFGS